MNKTTSLVAVAFALLFVSISGAAAAQEQTPANGTQFQGPDTDRELALVIDNEVAVQSWEYEENEFRLWFYSESYKTVTIAAAPSGGSNSGSVRFQTVAVDKGSLTHVTIASDGPITLWTDASVEKNRAHYLKPQSDIIGGPYSGDDVRNAAIGGALAVIIGVFYQAVAAKIGASNRGERVA